MVERKFNLEETKDNKGTIDGEEIFEMSDDEIGEMKSRGSFFPFWSNKEMQHDKVYKFKCLNDTMSVREIEDKFVKKPTPRIMLNVEELETGLWYTISANKDRNERGKYSSLTDQLRKLYALTKGKGMKGTIFTFIKTKYKHETYGETDGYIINIVQ